MNSTPSQAIASDSSLTNQPFRILALDGGGAKGFYTLGVLKELEAMLGGPLHAHFDLIFGTSTGSIIAALLALGYDIDAIHKLYVQHVPRVMSKWRRSTRTKALRELTKEVFGEAGFSEVKTGIGIVTARWLQETPMIFKAHVGQTHGRKATFVPGFGVSLAQVVQASCSAYPFFERTTVTTSTGDVVELIDGGYCANNPTLYAIADAVAALGKQQQDLRVVSIGVGTYPEPKWRWSKLAIGWLPSVRLLQKTLEINTKSMDALRTVLFKNIDTVRIDGVFTEPALATDLLEDDLDKLNMLRQQGRQSFAPVETKLRQMMAS